MAADSEIKATGSTVTVELRCGDKFLLVRRPDDDPHYPGYWAFPGGRVHAGESFIRAAERECREETGISPTGRLYFVDSYPLEGTDRTGIHFTFEASDDVVTTDEFPDYRWVTSVEEMSDLEPRIPGIDNHAVYSARRLVYSQLLAQALDHLDELQKQVSQAEPVNISAARQALQELTWLKREETDLTRPYYLNG